MAFQGYDVQAVLENTLPDPMKSVRAAMFAFLASIPLPLVVCYFWPYFPLFFVVVAACCAIGAWKCRRMLRDAQRDEQELVLSRLFTIDEVPIHPEDEADYAHDLAIHFRPEPGKKLKGTYWFMPGCPHTKAVVEEDTQDPDGTMRKRRMYRRQIIESYRAPMYAIRDHLMEHHGPIHEVVVEWWETHVRNRITKQIHGQKPFGELSADERREVAEKGLCEFLEGCCVGLRPNDWGRKYDKRPSHRHLSELRLLLFKRFVLDGDYPNLNKLKDVPWIRMLKRKWVYMGKGAQWKKRHAQRYYYEYFRDQDQIKAKPDPKAKGDTRFFGIIWREAMNVFLPYEDFKMHTLVLGGSGKGKTRSVEAPMIHGILCGASVVALDPKPDDRLSGLCHYFMCAVGREDDFQWLNLADAENPYNCTFNPIFGVNDPKEYGNLIGALMPATAGENQFFLDESKRVGRLALTISYWINQYLALLSDGNSAATQPPKALLWIAYCRQIGIDGASGSKEIKQALVDFEDLYRRMWRKGSEFIGTNDVEKKLEVMWRSRFYQAEAWIPCYLHAQKYACQKPWRMVSWVVRLVHFHILEEHDAWSAYEWPESDDRDVVIGAKGQDEEGEEPLLKYFRRKCVHPLDPEAEILQRDYLKRWKPLYEVIIPRERVAQIRVVLRELRKDLEEQIANAQQDLETYKKHTGQLDAPVSLITAGGNGRILTEPNPHITWEVIHLQRKATYLATTSMIDGDTSDTVCKSFTKSLLTYGGKISATGGEDMDLVFIGDEMASWVTKDWSEVIDKLRSCGIRTFSMSQSLAGIRSRVSNEDLIKHMYSNFNTLIQYASKSRDDGEAFVEGLEKCQFFAPKRTITENPSFGHQTGHIGGSFSTGESWSLDPADLPLIDPDAMTRMPVGQCWIRQEEKVYLVQSAWLNIDYVPYTAQIGLNQKSNRCEVEGVHFYVENPLEAHAAWGDADRLDAAQVALAEGPVSAEDIDDMRVPIKPDAKGYIDPFADNLVETADEVPIDDEDVPEPERSKRSKTRTDLNSMIGDLEPSEP
jgi:hypothetical protein